MLPPPVSEESSLFEPPKTGNSEKLFPLIPFGKFQAVLNERSLNIHRNFPSYISEKRPMIRTPENKKIRKTFFSPHTLWEEAERFERKKTEKQRKSPESRLHAAIVPQYVRFSGLIGVWGSADPRGPNFAEIHARGRRGRLESDHRDLIPPWGHGLLHGDEEKPTMAVWHDRYEGMFHHG